MMQLKTLQLQREMIVLKVKAQERIWKDIDRVWLVWVQSLSGVFKGSQASKDKSRKSGSGAV